MIDIKKLLMTTAEAKASDLHLITGVPPTLRIDGVLKTIPDTGVVTAEDVNEGLKVILSSEQYERLAANKEIDFSLSYEGVARFRVNAYTQRGNYAAAFRRIPVDVPNIETLGLPKIINSLIGLRQGLVLVTGPTGHGKSTTLAAVINEINKTRSCHIVTIEDPVEFVFKPAKSIISQREMRSDTHSWQVALRSILREDPDVCLIGEMRDHETIASALTVAETGHLVFATLHTNSAAQTIDRIVDVFPEDQQGQVRMQLSSVLEAVISQRLIPAIPTGRVLATEVMLGTTAIKTTVREGKTHQIDSIIQTSQEVGMSTLESSLADLVRLGRISLEDAQSWSIRTEELNRLIKGSV